MSKSTQKKVGALAIAAAIGVTVVASMLGEQGGEEATTSADKTPTVAPEAQPAVAAEDAAANAVNDEDSATEPTLSPTLKIEQTGNNWAPLFAANDRAACEFQTQPLCERIACERVGGFKIRNCTPPSTALQKSFEGATVQDIAIKGDRAAVRFSNGEVVELEGDADPSPLAGVWYVHKLVGNAGRGFFE